MSASQNKFLFTSERLGFRLYQETDFANYCALDTDPDVRAFFPNGTLTPEQVRERIAKNKAFHEQHGFGGYIVIELATGEFIGRAGFGELLTGEIEAGYVFHKKFWGKGYATEALMTLLDYAEKNLPIEKIIAFTGVQHFASQRVMQKAGMEYDRHGIDVREGDECIFYRKLLRK